MKDVYILLNKNKIAECFLFDDSKFISAQDIDEHDLFFLPKLYSNSCLHFLIYQECDISATFQYEPNKNDKPKLAGNKKPDSINSYLQTLI